HRADARLQPHRPPAAFQLSDVGADAGGCARPRCVVRPRGRRRPLLARPARGGGMSGTPVGNDIRRLRFERGEMTQQALADACGVTRQTIIALEAGKYAPSLELAFRIAHALDVRIEDVFHWSKP